ncbi:aldehyde dehydrogenase family 8 member A1 [Lingula anatina]|uniref:Aldehyde dehydrogenase family 8 member A1 n=1 Tax=Lingula anatina TaxID=7574 RepID=A0A1S3IS75_LINAN|nr:aldehyde dehydrogenase family 8 member A1 [Lingula anatina]|eukprot:XP_013400923.1 aldehyde dehydrogenase family 8 member A1 [Lingula anatina]
MAVVVSNFVNGEFVAAQDYIDSINPATGELWAKIPNSTEDEVNVAVAAAKNAFEGWSTTTIQDRSKILQKIADLLEKELKEFAEVESRDQGKPVSLATNIDIPRAVYNFRFFATSILHIKSDCTFLDGAGAVNYVQHVPVGVAGLISPWNLPMYLVTWKIAPCIAFGNTCVVKPSEMTSVTAFMLCKVFQDAGLPPGVVNMVCGTGPRTGEVIIRHPDVPLISFTGSTAVGRHIQEVTAPNTKKLSLELGGKNAAIIFEDCDLANCITTTLRSSFTNQGEVCLCTSRIFVQEGIYSEFIQRFVEASRQLKVGDPTTNVNLGALISAQHLNKVKSFVELARKEGATIQCGQGVDQLNLPNPENKNGYFFLPTVITNVSDSSELMQSEIFGPVVCIVPFTSEQEVIKRANNCRYGLCATVWTKDLGRAQRVARKMEVGTVWTNCWLVRDLNMPFGGMKDSGIGRESATDSLEFFTEKKTICMMIGT